MQPIYVVEQTRDDSNQMSLGIKRDGGISNGDPTRWQLVKSFKDDSAYKDACRAAMELRDAGRDTTGFRPVVRVRQITSGEGRVELIMQRVAYRVRGQKLKAA